MRFTLSIVALGLALAAVPAIAAAPEPAEISAPTALGPAVNRAVAERAAEMLEQNYLNPAMGKRYAAALRGAALRGDYAAFTDRETLAERLTGDLQAVAPDGHLHFYLAQPPAPPPAATGSVSVAGPATEASGIASDRPNVPGIRAMKWIAPGVAYVSFEHFDDRPQAMAAIAAFLRDYASAKALIIDSRENFGGAFDMMGLLANHLFPTSRLLAAMDMAPGIVARYGSPFPVDGRMVRRTNGPDGLVRFQHWSVPATDITAGFKVPVFYLTSHKTYSAAEHMAMILKTTGRATLIGETTGGGNHFGGTEPVGGGLELFVPIGHTTEPATGHDWERVGIAPDVEVPAASALDEALRRIAAMR